MKILGKTVSKLLVIGVLIFACIICSVAAIIYSSTPASKASSTQRSLVEIADLTEKARPSNTQSVSSTSIPSEIRPSDTPTVHFTHTSTYTPGPTHTQAPTKPPTETPAPLIFTGSGDSIIDVDKGTDPVIVHIIGNASSNYFAVINYDSNNEQIDLLVNTTDPYDGFRPVDLTQDDQTVRFEVKAAGAWTIEVLPFSEIEWVSIPGEISGNGDYVFALSGETPDKAIISGNADSAYFAIIGYAYTSDLLVNTTDPYDGTVLLESGTLIIEVKAEGEWTIEFTSR